MLLEARKAFGEWSLMPKPPVLTAFWARSHASCDGDLDDSAETVPERGRLVTPAEAQTKTGGVRVAEAKVWETEGGAQKCEASAVSNLPPRRGLWRVDVRGPGLGRDVPALRGVWLKALPCRPVLFFKACEEGPCGLMGTADGSVVELETRHVRWTVAGFGEGASF